MTLPWSDLGRAPDQDEIEFSFFGPGFGECIVGHVGHGNWLVVDSCIDPSDRRDRRPVAERYLLALGLVPADCLRLVVATHWHDDHVQGLAKLLESAPLARFAVGNVFSRTQFVEYLRFVSTGGRSTGGGKVSEFNRVLSLLRGSDRPAIKAAPGRIIASFGLGQNRADDVQVMSLSPSDKDMDLFFEALALRMPQVGEPQRVAIPIEPNHVSIVLHVKLPGFCVLLGADMELVSDQYRGWRAVLQEASDRGLEASSVVKVAHHGSQNGHHQESWDRLVLPNSTGVVTPFNRLPVHKKLPTDPDLQRLLGLTSKLFLTSGVTLGQSARQRDRAVVRSLRESGIQMRRLDSSIGMVRLRRKIGQDGWTSEHYAPAFEVPRVA